MQSLVKRDITTPNFLALQGKLNPTPSITTIISVIAWIILGIPLFILAIPIAGVNMLVKKFTKPAKKDKKPVVFPVYEASNAIAYNERPFDLIVFGATGFTGKLAVQYIIEHYGDANFSWAIAGRKKAALQNVLDDALATVSNSGLRDTIKQKVKIVIADSDKVETLRDMIRSTRSIITTCGPFDKYGNDVVALCAAYGTHYADITGETDWTRKMIDNYEKQAQKSGAIMTSFAGHDCIPWDQSVRNASELLQREYQQDVAKIEVFDYVSGSLSGGTLATILHSLIGRVHYKSQLGFDPLQSLYGVQQRSELKCINQSFLNYNNKAQSWVGPFVMAPVMGNCIRRSNAILHYSPNTGPEQRATYKEMFCFPNLWEGIAYIASLLAMGLALALPVAPQILSKIHPPGSGPSPAQQESGYLLIKVLVTGTKGAQTEGWCYVPKDPGYYYTARMLVETGLTPILNKEEVKQLPRQGGYWTPAACLGPILQTRLEAIGIQFITRPVTNKH